MTLLFRLLAAGPAHASGGSGSADAFSTKTQAYRTSGSDADKQKKRFFC